LSVAGAAEVEVVARIGVQGHHRRDLPDGVRRPQEVEGDVTLNRDETVVFSVSLDLPWFEMACAPKNSDNYARVTISVTAA